MRALRLTGGAMTEHAPTPPGAKRLVYKVEELRRKHDGKWDARTMVSVTSPEGAALLASQRASPEKVADAQPIAIEPLKNETLPSLSTRDEIISDGRRLISERRVGAMLGFSKRTLQRWRQENKGPPWVKIGRRIYYDEDKLKACIQDR
jgi:predicted DNA-binding transcriptional regulator AlpA